MVSPGRCSDSTARRGAGRSSLASGTRLALALCLASFAGAAAAAWFGSLFAGQRPPTVGTGTLADCPPTDNCVSSLASDPAQRVVPFRYGGRPAIALQLMVEAIKVNWLGLDDTDPGFNTEDWPVQVWFDDSGCVTRVERIEQTEESPE